MNKPVILILAMALMASFWTFDDAQAFRLITQEMVEKELVVETDLIKTADNFIILFDTSGTTNQMVPGNTISKIQAAKNLLKERNAWFPDLSFQAGLYVYTDNQMLTGTFKEVYGMQAYDRDRFAAAIERLPEKGDGAGHAAAGPDWSTQNSCRSFRENCGDHVHGRENLPRARTQTPPSDRPGTCPGSRCLLLPDQQCNR